MQKHMQLVWLVIVWLVIVWLVIVWLVIVWLVIVWLVIVWLVIALRPHHEPSHLLSCVGLRQCPPLCPSHPKAGH